MYFMGFIGFLIYPCVPIPKTVQVTTYAHFLFNIGLLFFLTLASLHRVPTGMIIPSCIPPAELSESYVFD